MPGGCYLDTMTVISYDNVMTGQWEELIVDNDEFESFLERVGTANHDRWYVVREFVVHAKECSYSACPWQHQGTWDRPFGPVDTKQPTG